jgi:hypothetical protein
LNSMGRLNGPTQSRDHSFAGLAGENRPSTPV